MSRDCLDRYRAGGIYDDVVTFARHVGDEGVTPAQPREYAASLPDVQRAWKNCSGVGCGYEGNYQRRAGFELEPPGPAIQARKRRAKVELPALQAETNANKNKKASYTCPEYGRRWEP